jgi:PKD domain
MNRGLARAVAVVASAACLAATCGRDAPTGPTPPAVTGGTISQSPVSVGVLGVSLFTFTAEGFASSNGEQLSYAWDFGDRTQATGGTVVTHLYTLDWPIFNVSVTATVASGASARAVRWGVQVRALTGRWGIRDSKGNLLLGTTDLTQDGTSVSGADIQRDCRVSVSGRVSAPRSVSLAYSREGSGCDPRLPAAFVFFGSADDSAAIFNGTMTPGGPARLVACDEAWECWQ